MAKCLRPETAHSANRLAMFWFALLTIRPVSAVAVRWFCLTGENVPLLLGKMNSHSSPPIAWLSTRVREGKNPNRVRQFKVVDDEWKSFQDEPTGAILLQGMAAGIRLDGLNSRARDSLKIKTQSWNPALIEIN